MTVLILTKNRFLYSPSCCVSYIFQGEDCDVERLDPKKADPEYFEYECLTVEEVEKLLNESVEKLNTILQITPSLAKVLLLEHQWMNHVVVDKYRQNANALLIEARIKSPNPANSNLATISTSTNTNADIPSTSAAAIAQVSLSVYSKNSSCNNGHSSSNNNNNNNNNSRLPGLSGSNSCSTISHQYRSQMCPVCATVHLGDKFYSLACGHVFCKDCWSMYFETQIFQVSSSRNLKYLS